MSSVLIDAPTTHQRLLAWVQEMADLCEPASVHWLDGSDEDAHLLVPSDERASKRRQARRARRCAADARHGQQPGLALDLSRPEVIQVERAPDQLSRLRADPDLARAGHGHQPGRHVDRVAEGTRGAPVEPELAGHHEPGVDPAVQRDRGAGAPLHLGA